MGRFHRILYAARFPSRSDRDFSCAMHLARTHGATLTVLGVACPRDPDRDGGRAPGAAERAEALWARCAAEVEALAARARDRGVKAESRVIGGDLVSSIVEAAEEGGHDLVMKMADAPGLLPFGGRDRRLLRDCPCPLWLLEPAQRGGARSVLAAVDVTDGRSTALNDRILRVAARVAAGSRAELVVVHAWSVVGEPILASRLAGVSRRTLTTLLATTRRERRQAVHRLLARAAAGREAGVIVRKGDPARVVRDVAWAREADVVVVGSSGRTGWSRRVWGSMADRILGRVPSSILVVRELPGAIPDGGERGAAPEAETVTVGGDAE